MDVNSSPKGSGLDLGMYVQQIEADAALLASAAVRTGPETKVPTCPEWTVRELVLHLGEVHRWATTIVSGAIVEPSEIPQEFLGPLPDDDHVLDWFAVGARNLVEALRAAPPDLLCWTFAADPPTPLLFWARRQTFETAVHRVDVEGAAGHVTPLLSTYAADGIDEILTGFVPRRGTKLRSVEPLTLSVALVDDAHAWHLTISEEPVVTVRENRSADCTISGRACDVYLALWNRQDMTSLGLDGDARAIELFRDSVKIQWR